MDDLLGHKVRINELEDDNAWLRDEVRRYREQLEQLEKLMSERIEESNEDFDARYNDMLLSFNYKLDQERQKLYKEFEVKKKALELETEEFRQQLRLEYMKDFGIL